MSISAARAARHGRRATAVAGGRSERSATRTTTPTPVDTSQAIGLPISPQENGGGGAGREAAGHDSGLSMPSSFWQSGISIDERSVDDAGPSPANSVGWFEGYFAESAMTPRSSGQDAMDAAEEREDSEEEELMFEMEA